MGGSPANLGRPFAHHRKTIRTPAAAAGGTLASVPIAAPGVEQGGGRNRTGALVADDIALPAG